MRRYIEFDDLAEAATRLHVLVFAVTEGCEVLLSEGPAVDVICAAASIPSVFPAVPMGQRRPIDGGVVNNTPISHADRHHLTLRPDPVVAEGDSRSRALAESAAAATRSLCDRNLTDR